MSAAQHPACRRRRGASAIEFALTLPILIVLLSAILDYGWYFWHRSILTTATADAVRLGVAVPRSSPPGPRATAELYAQSMMVETRMPCPGTSCTVQASLETHDGYRFLRLETVLQYEPLVGIIPTPDIVMTTSAMMLEDQPNMFYP